VIDSGGVDAAAHLEPRMPCRHGNNERRVNEVGEGHGAKHRIGVLDHAVVSRD